MRYVVPDLNAGSLVLTDNQSAVLCLVVSSVLPPIGEKLGTVYVCVIFDLKHVLFRLVARLPRR